MPLINTEGYTVNYGEDEELEEEEAAKQRALEAQRKKDSKKRGAFNVPSKAKVANETPAQNTYAFIVSKLRFLRISLTPPPQ